MTSPHLTSPHASAPRRPPSPCSDAIHCSPLQTHQNSTPPALKAALRQLSKHPPGYHPTLFRQRFLVNWSRRTKEAFPIRNIRVFAFLPSYLALRHWACSRFSISLQPTATAQTPRLRLPLDTDRLEGRRCARCEAAVSHDDVGRFLLERWR